MPRVSWRERVRGGVWHVATKCAAPSTVSPRDIYLIYIYSEGFVTDDNAICPTRSHLENIIATPSSVSSLLSPRSQGRGMRDMIDRWRISVKNDDPNAWSDYSFNFTKADFYTKKSIILTWRETFPSPDVTCICSESTALSAFNSLKSFLQQTRADSFFFSFCSVLPLKSLHDNPLQGKLSQELGNGPEIAARHKPIKCIPNWLLLARRKDALFSKFMSAFYFPELWWKYRKQVQYELVKLL